MKRYRTSFLLAALTASALAPLAPAFQQQEAAAQEAAVETLPSARALIDRFMEISAGRKMIEETSSVFFSGTVKMEAMGLNGTFANYRAKPNLTKQVTELGPTGEGLQGFDGKVAWMTHAMMGEQILEGASRMTMVMQADYGASLMPESDYDLLEVKAREKFEGMDCYRLDFVYKAPQDEAEAKDTEAVRTGSLFFDAESGLIVGRKLTQASPMGDTPVTAVLSDYTAYGEGGYLMPKNTRLKMGPTEVLISIEKVEFDTVDPEEMKLPASIRALVGDEKPKEMPKDV
ncbi:MAG: hypothetical protein AAF682_08345 [Planctomycetota bacterium]